MSWLGLDVGTSGCKALVVDTGGAVLARAWRGYAVARPEPGAAELEVAALLAACRAVVAEAVAAAGAPPTAMAIACQGEAVAALDSRGRAIAPLLVSSDARPLPEAAAWSGARARASYKVTGHTAHPMFSLFKLQWLRRARPRLWERAAAFHCVEDLIHRDLGLEPAMGWPLAGRTMLFDVVRHDWDDGLLAAAGVPRAALPRTLPSGAVVGRVGAAAARRWGLPAGIIVAAGGHDQPLAALGAGAVRPGQAAYATGTVECLCPCLPGPRFGPALRDANLCTYDHAVAGRSASVAFSLTGGNLLDWFRALRGDHDDPAALLAALPPEPSGLLCLPYLTPSGTPHFDAVTPGAVIGLRLSTTPGELLRGMLEGIACELRLNLDLYDAAGIAVDELRATGGPARSAAWNQLRADVLGVPLAVAEVADAGCLGAAMLAASAAGEDAPEILAGRWVRLAQVFAPDPARAACYAERFAAWRQVYPAVRGLAAPWRRPPIAASSAA